MGAPGGAAGLEILCDGFNARPGSPVTPRAAWTAVRAKAKGCARIRLGACDCGLGMIRVFFGDYKMNRFSDLLRMTTVGFHMNSTISDVENNLGEKN